MFETPQMLKRFRWLRHLSGVHHIEAPTNSSVREILQQYAQKNTLPLAGSNREPFTKKKKRGRKPECLDVRFRQRALRRRGNRSKVV